MLCLGPLPAGAGQVAAGVGVATTVGTEGADGPQPLKAATDKSNAESATTASPRIFALVFIGGRLPVFGREREPGFAPRSPRLNSTPAIARVLR